jgi:sugar lactone lactonase YvrE
LNDVRFSPDGRTAFITDSGTRGAIIVVDLESGEAFRALDGHPSTQIDPSVTVQVDGKALRRPDGRQPAFASDGIAISRDGQTLYWQALTGKTLYSIATSYLDKQVPDIEREQAVKIEGTTHVADGLWMHSNGTLYLTSPGKNAITRWDGREAMDVVSDRRLRWPDTMSEGPDGSLYVTASHIQDTNWFNPTAAPAVRTALFRLAPEFLA